MAAWLAEHRVGHVHAGAADHLGIWLGKRMLADAALAAAGGHGVAFSEGVFGLDIAGGWVDAPAGYEGWYPSAGEGYPDCLLHLLAETATVAPWLDGEAWVLGSWLLPDGTPVPVDPRACLERMLRRSPATACDCAAGSSSSSTCSPSPSRRSPLAGSRRRGPSTTAPTRTTPCARRSICRCSRRSRPGSPTPESPSRR